ncbi:hypothetical protein MTR67_006888 [Solanum verrucosum]|uniref:RNase H type-1 domain-containing protein n=1 Tax=Solanum verrucosum TaxID=315347 RepID=A0AAF0PZ63_SOLVR|nr:hypothetical protein MTR67_006888 [Solanum verrucosum]
MQHLLLTAPTAQRLWRLFATCAVHQLVKANYLWLRNVPYNWNGMFDLLQQYRPTLYFHIVKWSVLRRYGLSVTRMGQPEGIPGESSYGFCIRDNKGDLVYAEAQNIGITTNMEEETTTVWKALQHCKRQGITHIILETDSLSLKNMIRRDWKVPWTLIERIEKIQDNMNILNTQVVHIYREGNQLVDYNTNIAINHEDKQQYASFYDLPIKARKILNMDKHQIPATRMSPGESPIQAIINIRVAYPTDKSFIAIDESSGVADDSSVATEGLPIGYILQYQTKLGKNQKLVTTYESFIATYESFAALDNSSIATDGLPVEYMLQYQAKLGQNQKFVQTDDEIGHDVEEDQTPTPIVDIGGNSQLKQLNNLQDDEIGFYIGMTFMNKKELVTSLHIACLKKDFRLSKSLPAPLPSRGSSSEIVHRRREPPFPFSVAPSLYSPQAAGKKGESSSNSEQPGENQQLARTTSKPPPLAAAPAAARKTKPATWRSGSTLA